MTRKKKPKIHSPVETQKKASSSYTPRPQKKPKIPSITSSNKQHPSWRFLRIELADPFGWNKIKSGKIHDIRKRLQSFETMTWNEILIKNKKHNHTVSLESLCRQAKDRLTELKLDDIDELVSLKISSMERIWGIKQQAVFLILWWDPDHQVCPSFKKNT